MLSGALPPNLRSSAPIVKLASGCGRPLPLCASMATSFAGRRHGGGRGGRRIQTCFDSVYDLVQFSRNQKEDSGDVMNIEEIIQKPITTHEYPDPTEARRYICDDDGFYGYDYVFLEDATWHALCHIALDRGGTVDELCGDIDLNFAPGEDFAPAARRYVLRYVAERLPANIELPPELCFLRALDERRSLQ